MELYIERYVEYHLWWFHKKALYAEFRYAECHHAECHYAECRGAFQKPTA